MLVTATKLMDATIWKQIKRSKNCLGRFTAHYQSSYEAIQLREKCDRSLHPPIKDFFPMLSDALSCQIARHRPLPDYLSFYTNLCS